MPILSRRCTKDGYEKRERKKEREREIEQGHNRVTLHDAYKQRP